MKNKRLLPLNSLQAFEAAGRHESFLDAAAEQSVSPGSISRHVRLLENYLGTELFVRRRNGVTLTSAGRELAETVSHVQGPASRDGARPQAAARPRDRDLVQDCTIRCCVLLHRLQASPFGIPRLKSTSKPGGRAGPSSAAAWVAGGW